MIVVASAMALAAALQFDELKSQAANDRAGAQEEPEKLAATLPKQGQWIRLGIAEGIRAGHEGKRNRNERSLFRGLREGNQRVGAVAVWPKVYLAYASGSCQDRPRAV